MRGITKTLLGRECDRRIALDLAGARWGQPPVARTAIPPQYAATHYALEQVHRRWLRRTRPSPAELADIWHQAWRRAAGDEQAPLDGLDFLLGYAALDPFGVSPDSNWRQIVGIEVELVTPTLYGYSWSSRPDLICVSHDRTTVEAIEVSQAATLRQADLTSALDQVGMELCLPERLRRLDTRVVFGHVPAGWQMQGWRETNTTLATDTTRQILQSAAAWLDDLRTDSMASPSLGACGVCPFSRNGACLDSLYGAVSANSTTLPLVRP